VRLPLACLAACLLVVVAPAAASASAQLTNVKLTPSTTQAGGHPNVTVDLAFSLNPSTDDVKSVGVVLPQGLVGNPSAADRCSEAKFKADQCPDGSKVGTQTAEAEATVLGVPMQQTVPGDVYNLTPHAGEPARLGVVLRPTGGSPVFLESAVTVGPRTGFGLATKFDNLPRSASVLGITAQIRLKSMKLTLNGGAAHGKFITNPTSCRPATMTATITTYDQPSKPVSGKSSFTPTGCSKLPFRPGLSGTVGGAGQTKVGTSPTLVAIVAARSGDANASRVAVTLPAGIGVNLGWAGTPCPQPVFAAGNCGAAARVGSAVARSPLLATPINGKVFFLSDAATGLPAVGVQFGPPVALALFGKVAINGDTLVNTFTGIPDLPLSRFQLTIAGGGKDHLLSNGRKLCGRKTPPLAHADLLAHSGKTATANASLAVLGCPPGSTTTVRGGKGRPRATLSMRFRHRRGSLSARFTAARKGPRLKRARLAVPKRLRTGAHRGKLPKHLRVTAGGHRVARKRVHLRGHLLDVRLKGSARTIRVRWTAIKPTRKLARRLKHRPRLTFVARLTDAKHRTTRLKLTVRPAVRPR
jgi:hypothetical protein